MTDTGVKLSSTERAIAERCREAIQVATRRTGWWASPVGQSALSHLQVWGATIRIRAASGDVNALPVILGKGGSRQGCTDGMSVNAMIYESVDRWVAGLDPRGRSPQKTLLYWVYVHATEDQSILVRYRFPDGTWSDPSLFTDPEPAAYASMETLAEAWVQTSPISKIPVEVTLPLDSAFVEWGDFGVAYWERQRIRFLETAHETLARQLAHDLEL